MKEGKDVIEVIFWACRNVSIIAARLTVGGEVGRCEHTHTHIHTRLCHILWSFVLSLHMSPKPEL